MIFKAGTIALRTELLESAIVAVDLGFSQKSKSTGVAWRLANGERPSPQSCTFADGVKQVVGLIRDASPATLILEAPLSAQFYLEGNPAIRLKFERRFDGDKKRHVSRPWYSGPGATTFLAALFFLRRIRGAMKNDKQPPSVVLFEGLHTFKSGTTKHERDANELLDAFISGEVVDVTADEKTELLSVLNLLGHDDNDTVPSIVRVNQPAE